MQCVCACVFRVTIMSLMRPMPSLFPCRDSGVRFSVFFFFCISLSFFVVAGWCCCYFAIACLLKFSFSIHVKLLCFVFYQWTKCFRVYLLVNRYTKIVQFKMKRTNERTHEKIKWSSKQMCKHSCRMVVTRISKMLLVTVIK